MLLHKSGAESLPFDQNEIMILKLDFKLNDLRCIKYCLDPLLSLFDVYSHSQL